MVNGETNHWLLLGRMGTGKSTFASQMSPEYLVLDFDGRWNEQQPNVLGNFHLIQNDHAIGVIKQMEALRPTLKSKVGTVVVDSGTALLDYEQSLDRLRNINAPDKKWMNEAYKRKADIMRVLSGAILRWQCNSIWIFHIEDSTLNGQTKIRQTIPNTELERLKKSLNAVIEIFRGKDGKRGAKIVWCRYNDNAAEGQVVWDTNGMWEGIPERLSIFLRNFKGNEGYNGNAYSIEWLHSFLASKGKEYPSIEEMVEELSIDHPPLWFDRAGWAEYIAKAGV